MTRPYFIAYASPDRPVARQLFDALTPHAFLDVVCVQPGDWWDDIIPQAQQAARITVALISAHTDRAFYLRNELATAIELSRRGEHRLVPVYLDSTPAPYGLARVHSLRLSDFGSIQALAGAISGLLDGVPAPGQPPEVSEADHRLRLYENLCRLLSSQLEEIIFRLALPQEHIAPKYEVQAKRAMDVILVAQQRGVTGQLEMEIRRAMGG